jgi:hypothetical protein
MADEAQARSLFFWWRRWYWLVVLLVVRVVLPVVVRRVVVSQATKALQTRVEVGDVDLALWRGGVTLKDVAVYSPTPERADAPPLVAWKRFGVSVRYLPLLWKTIRLRQVLLEAPRIALDRLADGELNLERLVPKPAAGTPAAPEAAGPPAKPWKIGIDRLVLRAGAIRFRDLTLAEGEPLEIAIPDISVDEVGLQPGLYGEPGRLRLYVKSEGGVVRVDSRLAAREEGFALDTRVKAYGIPLRRARFYVPGIGWSELGGKLDTVVDHALAPGGRNEVRGIVRLRNVAIRVPDLTQAALGVDRFAVRVGPVDLAAHRATVTHVDLAGASVVVDLQGGEVLPLLRPGAASQPAPPTEATAPTEAEAPAPATPWHWTVKDLRIRDSRVAVLDANAAVEVGVTVAARDLSDVGEPGHVGLALAVPPGRVGVSGAVAPVPPRFGGTVRIEQLPLHDLVRAARALAGLPPGLVRAAVLDTDLAIEAGLGPDGAAPERPDAVRARGLVRLDGVDVAGPDPDLFAVSWKKFTVPVDALELPGLVPGAPAPADAPLRVALGAVRLEEPSVQAARSGEGIVLPPPLARSPDHAAEPPPTPAASPGAARPVDATIASFVLAHGRIAFTDQTVAPFFTGEVKPIDLEARGIRSQGPAVEGFTLSARTPQKGRVDVTGTLRPAGGTLKVNGRDVALAPYNPFVTAYSPYSIGQRSTLSVATDVKYGDQRWDTNTAITLHRLTVRGAQGDTLFKEHFGIPLSVALALLRDLEGNIKLDVPVVVDQSGATVELGTVVAGALRSAILGAVTSPLKGIGAILGAGDGGGGFVPAAVAVELGRAALTPDGEKTVDQLAELLAARPGVALALDPVVTPADARWLQEQDLRAELEARSGVLTAIRGLPERNVRRRVVQALAARATGKAGDLDRDDQAKLDAWLGERPTVPPARLEALARDRAAAVASALRERHGIDARRVSVSEATGKPREGKPAVLVDFGAADT